MKQFIELKANDHFVSRQQEIKFLISSILSFTKEINKFGLTECGLNTTHGFFDLTESEYNSICDLFSDDTETLEGDD